MPLASVMFQLCFRGCVVARSQWQTCLVYSDDFIISGRSFPKYLNNLRAVFVWLRDAGLNPLQGNAKETFSSYVN